MNIIEKLQKAQADEYQLNSDDAAQLLNQFACSSNEGRPNPFVKYRDILLDGGYSASQALQKTVLNLYNPRLSNVDGPAIRNMDEHHRVALHEILNHYAMYGESCSEFMAIAKHIQHQLREQKRNKASIPSN